MKFSKEMFSSKNLYIGFLHIAVIVLALQVVVLARQNNELKNPSVAAQKEQLKEGDYFYYGELEPVREGAVPDTNSSQQLVFIFTTRCPFCKDSLPFWKQMANENNTRYSVIGISLDPLENTTAYLVEHEINFPVFLPGDVEWFIEQIKGTTVPKTIMRNNYGSVEKIILGRLKKEQLPELTEVALVTHN
ncbi:MAG: redoxin domain-containing protein [Ignavibacteriae bacterium]|nr:redoxin domain-containing protein [Ignavibacteriota bacterium]